MHIPIIYNDIVAKTLAPFVVTLWSDPYDMKGNQMKYT